MIQPLKSSRTSWTVFWVDLDEPLPSGTDFILPTLMIVVDSKGAPIAPPEILEELDQPRIEQFLGALIDRLGAPDRIVIGESEEWDPESWQDFAEDFSVHLQFTKFARRDGEELRAITAKVVEQYPSGSGDTEAGVRVASGLVNTALRVRSESKKIALLKKAIDSDAECTPARIELADAEFRRGDWNASLRAYDKVIALEEPRWSGRRPDWWKDTATRTYLRAIYGRAMTLWHQGRFIGAAETLSDLLEINPRDHQGARFLVPLVFMLGEDFDAAQFAYDAYEESYPKDYAEPSFLFGWGLLHAYFGRDADAKAKFQTAILKNLYIAPAVLGLPSPSEALWHPSDRGESSYAREFMESYGILWERAPGALRVLREAWEEMEDRIEALIALRSEMFDFQDQRYQPEYKRLWQELVARDEKLTALTDA